MTVRFDSESHFVQWNEEMARKYDSEDYHLRSNFLIRWVECCMELIDISWRNRNSWRGHGRFVGE